MSDDHSDGTIVEGIVGLHVEERILENTSWEADFVGRRVVVCVDRLRCHVPLVAVNRLVVFLLHMFLRGPEAYSLRVLIEVFRRVDIQF